MRLKWYIVLGLIAILTISATTISLGSKENAPGKDGSAPGQEGSTPGKDGSAPGKCNKDSDGDGTNDCNDGCPNDPKKANPGTCGCGIPDEDDNGRPNC